MPEEITSIDGMDWTKFIVLKSNDFPEPVQFKVTRDACSVSKLLKKLFSEGSIIPLPRVNAKVLRLIIPYMEHHAEHRPAPIVKPLKGKLETMISDWDKEFIATLVPKKGQHGTLIAVLNAAEFMRIADLVDLCCAYLASTIANCNIGGEKDDSATVRKLFDLSSPTDVTANMPVELAAIVCDYAIGLTGPLPGMLQIGMAMFASLNHFINSAVANSEHLWEHQGKYRYGWDMGDAERCQYDPTPLLAERIRQKPDFKLRVNRTVIANDGSRGEFTDNDLRKLKPLTALKYLDLSAVVNCKITVGGLKELMECMPSLEEVDVGGKVVQSSCLKTFKASPSLKSLTIGTSSPTGLLEILKGIETLERLAVVSFGTLGKADEDKVLLGLPALKELNVSFRSFSSNLLKPLDGSETLEKLDMCCAENLNDELLEELGDLPKLIELDIRADPASNKKISDAGLDSLVKFTSLQKLDLRGQNQITLDGIKKTIAALPSLLAVDLENCNVTTEGVEEIRKLMTDRLAAKKEKKDEKKEAE